MQEPERFASPAYRNVLDTEASQGAYVWWSYVGKRLFARRNFKK